MDQELKKTILDDLYEIDESLKKEEDKILLIIEHILKEKAKINYNQDFFDNLRKKILIEIERQKKGRQEKYHFFQNLSFSLAGLSLVLLLILIAPIFKKTENNIIKEKEEIAKFSMLNPQAFGDINIEKSNNIEGLGLGALDLEIRPDLDRKYRFILDEESLKNFDQAPNLVYKTQTNNKHFKEKEITPIDLQGFKDLRYSFIKLKEEGQDSYSVAINFSNQLLTISKELESAENEASLFDEDYIINLAKQFLNTYQISTEAYGEPYINKYWEEDVDFIPQRIQVFYPKKIDKYLVYNDKGELDSLQLDINLNTNEVVGLYNYSFANYEASEYNIVNNSEAIVRYFNNLNTNNQLEGEVIDVYLSQASFALLKTNYLPELYVPALVFKAENYYQKKFVIPLLLSYFKSSK